MSEKAGRRILGLTFDGRPIYEPPSAGSSICYAAAGGGKTTCVSVPAIECLMASASPIAIIANDVKNGEIAAQIAPMCLKYGRKFGVVDEFGVLGRDFPHRLSLNAFGAAAGAYNSDPDHLPFILENIVHALIDEPKDDAKNAYWRDGPREALELGARLLLGRNPRFCTPGGLYALLSDPVMFGRALASALEAQDAAIAAGARRLLDMQEHNPEHYQQHLRAALTALKIFSFGPLVNAGRSPDITHAQLIREGWIVCLVNPARYADRLGPFYAAHFLALMNAQLSGAGRAEYILDEFCNAPLREAVNRVTIQRAFGARSHFITQSRQDAVRRYGEKETALLEENCTVKQYLKFSSYEEAERISKAMGENLSVNRGLGLSSDKHSVSSNYSTGRERLFTAEELMRLPPDEQILHITDVGFIHCKKIRQNQFAPCCFDLADNPVEGGRLEPDPIVRLDIPMWRDAA
ncbi:MAG: type IV secretory system conjugative DNA transfer family protein [Rhizobiaceae bacterium]